MEITRATTVRIVMVVQQFANLNAPRGIIRDGRRMCASEGAAFHQENRLCSHQSANHHFGNRKQLSILMNTQP